MHCCPYFFPISLLGKVLQWLFQTGSFHLGDKKSGCWLHQTCGWLSYTVAIVWELAWQDSALVVLDKKSFYRDGHLNRFDCMFTENNLTCSTFQIFTLQNSFSNVLLDFEKVVFQTQNAVFFFIIFKSLLLFKSLIGITIGFLNIML